MWVFLAKKTIPDEDSEVKNFIEEEMATGGGVVTLESGREVLHKIRYRMTLFSTDRYTYMSKVVVPS